MKAGRKEEQRRHVLDYELRRYRTGQKFRWLGSVVSLMLQSTMLGKTEHSSGNLCMFGHCLWTSKF